MELMKISIDGITAATGESRSVVNDAINAGHLKTFLVGRRRFAKPEAVRAWVDFLEAASEAGEPVAYRSRIAEANRAQVRALKEDDGHHNRSDPSRR